MDDQDDKAIIRAIGLGPDNAGPTNGPAFPVIQEPGGVCHFGMTLRDYFAAKAMQAILMSGQFATRDDVISGAWEYADAMLTERAKK